MLGSYMWRYLNREFECTRFDRDRIDVCDITGFQNQFLLDVLTEQHTHVINCVGVLKPNIKHVGVDNTVLINTVWPQMLQQSCVKHNTRLIHISSDCVFSGKRGKYTENDIPDALDVYGRTKCLEPQGATTIRSSFVGRSPRERAGGLMNWILNQQQTLNGYTNCLWNGVTCLYVCELVSNIISGQITTWEGVRHVFSDRVVSKHELCEMISRCYNKHVDVIPTHATEIEGTIIDDVLDRSLDTVYDDELLPINTLENMLDTQKSFDRSLKI